MTAEEALASAQRRSEPHHERQEKTSERIARYLVRDIFADGFAPGDILPTESELLVRYEVGRPALREAIRILEAQDLIWVKRGPGGGPVVASATPEAFGRTASLFFRLAGVTFRELVEARVAIDPMSAHRC